MTAEGASFPGLAVWAFLVKWVCPVLAGVILLQRLWDLVQRLLSG